jgi:hypothetical protein
MELDFIIFPSVSTNIEKGVLYNRVQGHNLDTNADIWYLMRY